MPLFSGLRSPPQEILEMLRSDEFAADPGSPAVRGGYAVPVPVPGRDGTFLVALERKGAEPAGLGAVRHVATIAALELTKRYYEREAMRRRGTETIAKLFSGRLDAASAEAALEEVGFAPSQSLVVAAVRSTDGPLPDEEIHHRLCDLDIPHLLLLDRDLLVVVPAAPDILERVLAGLAVRAGISGTRVGVRAWSVARKEALWALERSMTSRNADGMVARFPGSEASGHWLPSDIGTLENLVDEILTPLLSYDAEHNSAMVETLTVFFDHDRQLKPASAELYIHKHTLSYRLGRIEEITGRDLSRMEDLVQLWLALRAYRIVADHRSTAGEGG
jgi:purine catabolism regulator